MRKRTRRSNIFRSCESIHLHYNNLPGKKRFSSSGESIVRPCARTGKTLSLSLSWQVPSEIINGFLVLLPLFSLPHLILVMVPALSHAVAKKRSELTWFWHEICQSFFSFVPRALNTPGLEWANVILLFSSGQKIERKNLSSPLCFCPLWAARDEKYTPFHFSPQKNPGVQNPTILYKEIAAPSHWHLIRTQDS